MTRPRFADWRLPALSCTARPACEAEAQCWIGLIGLEGTAGLETGLKFQLHLANDLLSTRKSCGRSEIPGHHSLDLWKYSDGIEVPILVLRGVKSDIPRFELALEMVRRNPRTRVHEIEGRGDAPPLTSLEQIQPVADFLTAQRSDFLIKLQEALS